MYKASSFAVFVSLTVFLAVMVSLVNSRTPAPTSCADLSFSCARCLNSTFNCRYAWLQPGLYNSPENASCLPADALKTLLYNNQYTRRVFAYALTEAEISTTRGQYLLSMGTSSALNFNATAVPCYDKQLCYCRVPPPPPPSNVTIVLTDCRNGNPIPLTANAFVTLVNRDNNTSDARPVVDTVNGAVNYIRVVVGNYSVSATAAGYSTNVTVVPEIGLNQTYTFRLCITPLPCTVTIRVVDALSNAVLPNAPVSLTTPAGPFSGNTSALPQGSVQFSYIAEGGVATATASYAGYNPNTISGITCTTGQNNEYSIPLTPLPGALLVNVVDYRTNQSISGATVTTVVVTSTQVTNTTGYVFYTGLAENNYRAFASAPGYTSNSSLESVFVPKGETRTLTVYLVELPCTVTINVLNSANNQPLAGAIAGLNRTLFQQTTPANGQVSFAVNYDAANASYAIRQSFLFVRAEPSNDGSFVCSRGGTATVTIYLREVIQVFVQAIEGSSLDPIPNAVITARDYGEVPLLEREGERFVHYLIVDSLPKTFEMESTALGYLDFGPWNFTFTANRTFHNISMVSIAFTVFIIPYEVTQDEAGNIIPQLPDIEGFVDVNNPLVFEPTTVRSTSTSAAARRIKVGGTMSRNDGATSLPSSFIRLNNNDVTGSIRWFAAQPGRNQYDDPVDEANNPLPYIPFTNTYVPGISPDIYNGDVYASSFISISPTSQSRLRMSIGITGYGANLDVRRQNNTIVSGSESLLELKIPNYSETQFRTLLFYLPSRLAQMYFLIFVYPFSDPLTRLTNFPSGNSGSNNINIRVGSSIQTSSVAGFQNAARLVHEFPLTVGVTLSQINVTVQEPPFSRTQSCWINPLAPSRLMTANGNPCVIPASFNLPGIFPPPEFFQENYINANNPVTPTGQRIRKAGSPNYISIDYGLVTLSGGKRTETDDIPHFYTQVFPGIN